MSASSNLFRPIGSNWNEQSSGSAMTDTGARRLRPRQRRIGGLGQRPEQREIGQRRERAAGHDDRLAPDLVRQPAEQDEEGRRQRQRDGDQDVGGRAVDLQRLLEEEQRVELPGVPDHRLPRDRADQGDDHQPQIGPARERLGQRRLRPLARRLHLAGTPGSLRAASGSTAKRPAARSRSGTGSASPSRRTPPRRSRCGCRSPPAARRTGPASRWSG